MANIKLRQASGNTEPRLSGVEVKNASLSNAELDNNFNNLNNDINTRLSSSGGIITGNLTITGNTAINSKNIILANNATPTNTTANGAGLVVLGTTNKTFNWSNTTNSWTSNTNIDLTTGNSYKINGVTVLDSNTITTLNDINSAQNNSINVVFAQANNAANIANTKLSSSGGTVTGDITANKLTISDVSLIGNTTPLFRGTTSTAITAMFIYDTSKDSDGGAWTEKCQHTSWYNETLTPGNWLGTQDSHTTALAVPGAVSGDYFQLATDGKFYRLWKNFAGLSEGILSSFISVSNVTLAETSITGFSNSLFYGDNSVQRTAYKQFNIPAIAVGGSITYSFYIQMDDGLTPTTSDFDLVVRSAGGVTGVTITEIASPIYRVSRTVTYASGAAAGLVNFGVAKQTSNNARSFRVSGHQVEFGSVATTYEQRTTNNPTTEVFRGNKRSFPKLSAIICDTSSSPRVTIYDLTEKGNPMWMFFPWVSSGLLNQFVYPITSVAAINAEFAVGYAGVGIARVNFIRDRATHYDASTNSGLVNATLAQRYTDFSLNKIKNYTTALPSRAVRDIAMTVMPDAPIDPVTGLKIPTIVAATDSRVVIIPPSGSSIFTSSNANTFTKVVLTPTLLSAGRADSTWYYATNPSKLGASFALSTKAANTAPEFNITNANTTLLISKDRSTIIKTSNTIINILRNNESTISKGLSVKIANTYNTGWMVGDIRRVYLSDAGEGSVTGGTVSDKSYKSGSANVFGTLTKTAVANNTHLVAYSGFSANNYIQEPYSADLDFGTGEWSYSAWINVPVAITANSFPRGSELWVNPTYGAATTAGSNTDFSVVSSVANQEAAKVSNVYDPSYIYEIIIDVTAVTGTWYIGSSPTNASGLGRQTISAPGIVTMVSSAYAGNGVSILTTSSAQSISVASVSVKRVLPSVIAERRFSSGAYITFGINPPTTSAKNGPGNSLYFEVYDGTTVRNNYSLTTTSINTSTTVTAINLGKWIKVRANYTIDGRVSALINGTEVSFATGTPLVSLNNSDALLTIGNSYATTGPFQGSLGPLKISATVPTSEQALFAYEQEKSLFQDDAKCLLPDANNIVDMKYDDYTDKLLVISANTASEWTGLVRVSTQTPSAGVFGVCRAKSNIRLLSRNTTNPGVDIITHYYNIKEELYKKELDFYKNNPDIITFDYDTIGFNANTTNTSSNLTSVTVTGGTPYVGMYITGVGIPTGTYLTAIYNNYYYMSANSTITSNAVTSIGQSSFTLPIKYVSKAVYSGGTQKREGATKDYTKMYDGFKETIVFNTSPSVNTWVQIHTTKEI